MSNSANITQGPDGTPTQEWWDGFIGRLDNCPNTEVINRYVSQLNDYIKKINDAIEEGEKEIYDATIGKFNECKQEIMNYLSEKQREVEEEINDFANGKKDEIEGASDTLEAEIEDLTLKSTLMEAENLAGDNAIAAPTGSLSALNEWAATVKAYITAQKTTTLQQIEEIKNTIKRIKKKYDPIVAAVAWWPETIVSLANYSLKRVNDIADAASNIGSINPPKFQESIQ